MLLLTAGEPEQRRLDNAERMRRLRELLPHVGWRTLAACRHDVFIDAPERVADEIADWWTRPLQHNYQ